MAKYNAGATAFLAFAFLLSLLLASFITAESRKPVEDVEGEAGPVCDTVYGAVEGDTCSSVAETFGLGLESFIAINPNLNCTDIFVGEWLCIQGTTP